MPGQSMNRFGCVGQAFQLVPGLTAPVWQWEKDDRLESLSHAASCSNEQARHSERSPRSRGIPGNGGLRTLRRLSNPKHSHGAIKRPRRGDLFALPRLGNSGGTRQQGRLPQVSTALIGTSSCRDSSAPQTPLGMTGLHLIPAIELSGNAFVDTLEEMTGWKACPTQPGERDAR